MTPTAKKSMKEHFTLAEIIKNLVLISTALGLTAVSSDAPAISERVIVLETRMDPMLESMEDNTKLLRAILKTQDSLVIVIRNHTEKDRD